MKKALVFCIALFGLVPIHLPAQSDARPFFFGFGATYPWGGMITGGFYNQGGWGGTLTATGRWYEAKNRPADYTGSGLLFDNKNRVNDYSYVVALRALKEIPSDSKHLKFGIEAGPAWIHTSTADHFIPVTGWHFFSANYTYERVKDNSIGLSLRGKIEWSATRLTGFELGLNATISEAKSYFGIDLIETFGAFH